LNLGQGRGTAGPKGAPTLRRDPRNLGLRLDEGVHVCGSNKTIHVTLLSISIGLHAAALCAVEPDDTPGRRKTMSFFQPIGASRPGRVLAKIPR
jgi:hypothetical protein